MHTGNADSVVQIFEVICNAFAELTGLADRRFYDDWWNSTSFTEFSRKWNKPVHNWLLHHVYLPMQEAGIPQDSARSITFAVSILAHEALIVGFLGLSSPWLLLFSCFQFPLMSIMRLPIFKGKRLGGLIFWFGMVLGIPLVLVLYISGLCRREASWCAQAMPSEMIRLC